jgi:hypothetical protein
MMCFFEFVRKGRCHIASTWGCGFLGNQEGNASFLFRQEQNSGLFQAKFQAFLQSVCV